MLRGGDKRQFPFCLSPFVPEHIGGLSLSVTNPASMLPLQPDNDDRLAPPWLLGKPFAGDFKGKTKPDSVHTREDTQHATFHLREGAADLDEANIRRRRLFL